MQNQLHRAELQVSLTSTAADIKQLADASSIAITAPFNFCMLNAEEEVLRLSKVARILLMHTLHPGLIHSGLAFTVYGDCKHSYATTAALRQPLPSA